MLNFYSGLINPTHGDVQSKFFKQLSGCVKAYQISFGQEDTITSLINRLIEDMHGLIFPPNMTFYTSDWKMIIDASGHCDLDSYEVHTSAELFGEAPKRPAKGKIVDLEVDFEEENILTPHPIYSWISWVCILRPQQN